MNPDFSPIIQPVDTAITNFLSNGVIDSNRKDKVRSKRNNIDTLVTSYSEELKNRMDSLLEDYKRKIQSEVDEIYRIMQ